MKRKSLTVLALGVMTALSGCGGNEIVHVIDQSLAHEPPSSEVIIKFWECLGEKKENNLKTLVEEFNTAHKGQYKVVLDKPGGSTYNGLHDAIVSNISSGTVPALAMGYPDSFAVYMNTKESRSNILRLNNFYTDELYGYGNDINTGVDFVKSFYDEGLGYQFKGLWSLPMYKSTEVMFVNLDYMYGNNPVNDAIFAEGTPKYADYQLKKVDAFKDSKGNSLKYYSTAGHDAYWTALRGLKEWVLANGGVAYDVPERWDEMITIARQMRQDRADHGIDNSLFKPIGYDSDGNLMISQMMQRGIPYTSNDNITTKADHILFNNDQTIALLNELYGYYKENLFITKGLLSAKGDQYVNDEFTGKNVIMSVGSTGGSDYQVSDNFAVGVYPVPYSGSRPYYIQQGPSICFFDNESEQINTGAWLFYQYLADPANNVMLANENSYDPIRDSSYDTDEYKDFVADYKSALLNYVPTVTKDLRQYYFTSPVFIGSSHARNEMSKLLGSMRYNYNGSANAASEVLNLAYNAVYNKTK